jgi:hypothetical protein
MSDNNIESGKWDWVKIDESTVNIDLKELVEKTELYPLDELEKNINNCTELRTKININAIIKSIK